MKIIALLPVKNEAWCLHSYLSSVKKIADHIIALDDGSTDQTKDILQNEGVEILTIDTTVEKTVDMSRRRQHLLEAGRKAGGTHFVWLDADETFSANFIPQAREIISRLTPGQKIKMRWIHAWKNDYEYLIDNRSPFGKTWKDFIVCDNQKINFQPQFLSESRTPGSNDNIISLNDNKGVVIHWQFSDWMTVQWKQSWYRCTELIEGSRSARKINNTYGITLDNKQLEVIAIPEHWLANIPKPRIPSGKIPEYRRLVTNYFDTHGIEFFEPLQIWHIKELHDLFIEKVGREPRVQVFPSWLIRLNELRHTTLSCLRRFTS